MDKLPPRLRNLASEWVRAPVDRRRTLITSPKLLKRGTNDCVAFKEVGTPACFSLKRSYLRGNINDNNERAVAYEELIGWMIYLRDRSNRGLPFPTRRRMC